MRIGLALAVVASLFACGPHTPDGVASFGNACAVDSDCQGGLKCFSAVQTDGGCPSGGFCTGSCPGSFNCDANATGGRWICIAACGGVQVCERCPTAACD